MVVDDQLTAATGIFSPDSQSDISIQNAQIAPTRIAAALGVIQAPSLTDCRLFLFRTSQLVSLFSFLICLKICRRTMDRLDGPARLMIVSDLDNTMVDHDDAENGSLLMFNALWEANYRHDSLLVFSTGRSPTIYRQLRNEKPLLTPDITIMSVGTEIAYGDSMVRDTAWEQYLNQKWDRAIVTEETAKFPELTPQSDTEQRPHKVSFFVEKARSSEVIKLLSERLEKRGLDIKIIYSSGTALDVLPKGAGKGQALAYLLKKFKANGNLPLNVLVCGDSGNDAELFSVPGVYGVMVSNAQEELLQWHAENAKKNSNIIHSTERCAAGIIQAIGNFNLGPCMSLRNTKDFLNCKAESYSPGCEVVKFYLFYERWRRAEVEKSDSYMQSIFYSSGILVHPSGTEQQLPKCIDMISRLYGDREGKQYRVWVDQVLSAQIGSGAWLVKFDKWESNGEEKQCCITTVLLTTKPAEAPDGFAWVHVHQTWLDGWQAKDQAAWLF